jgi:uncharacterized protein
MAFFRSGMQKRTQKTLKTPIVKSCGGGPMNLQSMTSPEPINDPLSPLWELVSNQYNAPNYHLHGPAHWKRVERNGLLLATRTGADVLVVRLFALFHDSRRESDGWDYGHGTRGADYAATLRGAEFQLDDDRFELLQYACVWHTDADHHDDPTIGTCWDADRLDLGRVGVIPSAEKMSTDFGREIAEFGSIQPFLPRSRC